MTKEQITSLIRHVLSAIAGYLIAKGVLSDGMASETIGAILGIVSIVWSIIEKTFTLGKFEGTIRQIATVAGTFLVTYGVVSDSDWQLIAGLIGAVIATLLGQTDKLWANSTPTVGS